jgi:outer membrane immunogenic protein
VKHLLLSGFALTALAISPAMAADMPLKAPAPPPPIFSWTGFYIGVEGGAGWGTNEESAPQWQSCNTGTGVCGPIIVFLPAGAERSSYELNGWHGGGTVGFNWQNGLVVLGVEGDFSGSNIQGTSSCALGWDFNVNGVVAAPSGCTTKLAWFGTATARAGLAIDHALVYVKAGAAFGHFNESATVGFISNGPPTGLSATTSLSDNRLGVTAGIGVEYAVGGGWSGKIEYDYMDFGTKNYIFSFTGTLEGATVLNLSVDDREVVHVVKAGVNHKF